MRVSALAAVAAVAPQKKALRRFAGNAGGLTVAPAILKLRTNKRQGATVGRYRVYRPAGRLGGLRVCRELGGATGQGALVRSAVEADCRYCTHLQRLRGIH